MNRTDAAGALFALVGLLTLGRIALQPGSVTAWSVLTGAGSLVAGALFAFDGRSVALARDENTVATGPAAVALAVVCFLAGTAYAVVG